jgi:hypothetical protein
MPTVETVTANYMSTQWGYLSSSTVLNKTMEYSWDSQVCSVIYNNFGSGSWNRQNNYWASTTSSNAVDYLVNTQNPYGAWTWATVWWVGDYWQSGSPPHYCCQGYGGANLFDYTVYQNANNFNGVPVDSRQNFVFMWTCVNGGIQWNDNGGMNQIPGILGSGVFQATEPTYTPTNTNTQYGAMLSGYCAGMPYAWTGTLALSKDGYMSADSSNYCFISFQNHSPWLQDTQFPATTGLQYGYFPYYFYQDAMGTTHATIKASLDYACQQLYGPGVTFQSSQLHTGWWEQLWDNSTNLGWWYNSMKVYGNGNMILPY